MQKINALPTQAVPQTANAIPQGNSLELKDIHVPEQISNFPIAYGWWLLAALIILLAIFFIVKIKKSAKRNQVKKQALVQLKNNPSMTTSDTIELLKWAAMHYFSRIDLAKLFGTSLQKFLASQLPTRHQETFINLSEQAFLDQYHAQPNTSIDKDNIATPGEELNQAATLWFTHALPPKATQVTNKNTSINNSEKQGVNI